MAGTKLGLYEQIFDHATQTAIADLDSRAISCLRADQLDAGDSHSYLVQHLARRIGCVLRSLPVEGRLDAQVALCNKIIDLLEPGTPAASKVNGAIDHAGSVVACNSEQKDRKTRHAARDKLSNNGDATRSESCLATSKGVRGGG